MLAKRSTQQHIQTTLRQQLFTNASLFRLHTAGVTAYHKYLAPKLCSVVYNDRILVESV